MQKILISYLCIASLLCFLLLSFFPVVGRAQDLFVSDRANNRVLCFGQDGNFYPGSRENSETPRFSGFGSLVEVFVPSSSGRLRSTEDITFGPNGNLNVTGQQSPAVLRYNGKTGAFLDNSVPFGSGSVRGITFGPAPVSPAEKPSAAAAP